MDIAKIENNVRKTVKGCWNWQGAISSSGYGNIEEDGRQYTTHEYAWICEHGKIPKGKILRHKCHNTKCCNPAHLELGTHKENYEDSRDVHAKADAKRRGKWSVDGISYDTAKQAVEKTGISMNSIIKFTKNGKFDRKAYEKACKLSGTYPAKVKSKK